MLSWVGYGVWVINGWVQVSRVRNWAFPVIEILKLTALSLCAGMIGVGSWAFFIEHMMPSDAALRGTFWWEVLEIGFISSVFAVLTVPMWLCAVRNLNRARAEALATESIVDNIFRASPGLCAITDPSDDTIEMVSESWLSALGYQRDEVIGKTSLELHVWPTPKIRRRMIEGAGAAGGHLRDHETQFCAKSGKIVDVLLSAEKIIYEGEERLFSIAQDVSSYKMVERALRDSERRARAAEQQLRATIESISDGFVLYGADTRLIICNKIFRDMYQYSNEDAAPGVSWNKLGKLDVERGIVQTEDKHDYVERRERGEKGPPKTYLVQLSDGRRIQVRDRKTLEGGIVSIQSDVTEFENLLEELRQSRDELEQRIASRTRDLELEIVERKAAEIKMLSALKAVQVANQAKTDFLATVSHELRTPLNAIIGFTSVMKEGHFGKIENPRYQDYLGDIQTSGEHLLALINDILDVSAVEAGKLELSEDTCLLSVIIDESVRLVSIRAEKGNVRLRVADNSGDGLSIRVDERRMRQILVNLLSNAVKFTPAGGSAAIETVLGPERQLLISVTDSGIGMAEGDIIKAMQPFTQIGNPLVRKHEGTGLGLPLTKALVELHGGELVIESAPGKGTKVTVQLPASRLA